MALSPLAQLLRRHARPLQGADDAPTVMPVLEGAELVLLGEATHGTQEFYRLRTEITKRLITEHGFDAIAVESDWPDALRASRYAQGNEADASPQEALSSYERFPRWMWRNTETVRLLRWLRAYNLALPPGEPRIGFYGLDLYSLRSSMDAVLRYLQGTDPDAARRALARYACFDHMAEDPQRYGQLTSFGLEPDCERQVVQQLQEMSHALQQQLRQDGSAEADELFYAQQNARVVRNAEAYYRTMFAGRIASWNLRDEHMAETLFALREHLGHRLHRPARIVVWAHNSHIGDARATEMGEHGELNLGQLVRERAGAARTVLLGFTTHAGTVTAAADWDTPAQRRTVRPARSDSHEGLFHQMEWPAFVLPLTGEPVVREALAEPRLQRAIGVIYAPLTERISHYFHADLARQFDAVVHIDRTQALQPLDPSDHWQPNVEEETYPSGL